MQTKGTGKVEARPHWAVWTAMTNLHLILLNTGIGEAHCELVHYLCSWSELLCLLLALREREEEGKKEGREKEGKGNNYTQ